MRILIVCSTPAETVFSGLIVNSAKGFISKVRHETHQLDVLITGAGMVSTTFYLSRVLAQEKYDLAINAGICGAFDISLIGKTTNINADCFADLGAEEGPAFLDIFQIGLLDQNEFPFTNGWLETNYPFDNDVLNKLPVVKGITVNTTSGNVDSIVKLKARFNADIESMEGAAFIYCCKLSKVPCLQIRAVSNVIERRNRANWNIEKALASLGQTGKEILRML